MLALLEEAHVSHTANVETRRRDGKEKVGGSVASEVNMDEEEHEGEHAAQISRSKI